MYYLRRSSRRPVLFRGLLGRRPAFGTPVVAILARLIGGRGRGRGRSGACGGVGIGVDCLNKASEISFVRALGHRHSHGPAVFYRQELHKAQEARADRGGRSGGVTHVYKKTDMSGFTD